MLAWLRALELEESDRRRRELGRLAATRERLRVTVRHEVEEELEWLELSPDGSLLATSDGTLRMWDAHTGALLWETKGEQPRFSFDGRWLASAWQNGGTLREARSGRVVSSVLTLPETVVDLAIPGSSGTLLATVSRGHQNSPDEHLILWDLGDGSVLAGPTVTGIDWPAFSAFDPTGSFFATSYYIEGEKEDRCGVYLWSRQQGLRSIATTFCSYGAVAFDRGGRRLAVEDGGEVRFFATATGEPDVDPLPLGNCDYQLALRDDGTLVGSGWGVACLWDVDARAGASTPRWQDDLDSDYREKYSYGPDDLSPNGTRHALGGLGDTLSIWNTETGEQLGEPLLHGMQADLAAFAGDDRTVASGNEKGLVRVWDVLDGDRGAPPPAFTESRFSEESDGVHVSRWESVVLLVDLETGELRELQRGNRVTGLAFERGGAGLAVGWDNGEIDLWSLEGERIAGPLRQPVSAFGLAWHGDRLVAAEWGAPPFLRSGGRSGPRRSHDRSRRRLEGWSRRRTIRSRLHVWRGGDRQRSGHDRSDDRDRQLRRVFSRRTGREGRRRALFVVLGQSPSHQAGEAARQEEQRPEQDAPIPFAGVRGRGFHSPFPRGPGRPSPW